MMFQIVKAVLGYALDCFLFVAMGVIIGSIVGHLAQVSEDTYWNDYVAVGFYAGILLPGVALGLLKVIGFAAPIRLSDGL